MLASSSLKCPTRPIFATSIGKKKKNCPKAAVEDTASTDVNIPPNRSESASTERAIRYDVDDESNIADITKIEDTIEDTPRGYWVTRVEGAIPLDIQGTYYRNGPGVFNFLNEARVKHPFDANGILCSMAIKNGRAFFRSRFVDTDHSMLEEMDGRRLFRGVFGTSPQNDLLSILALTRNAGNGQPIVVNDRVYVAYENTMLTEIDPVSLRTTYPTLSNDIISATAEVMLRQIQFMGDIPNLSPLGLTPFSKTLDFRSMGGFGDHKIDGRRNLTIAHKYKPTISTGPSLVSKIDVLEFDQRARLHSRKRYEMDGANLIHSIAATDNWYVIAKFPMKFILDKMFDSTSNGSELFDWDPAGKCEYHLIPRPDGTGRPDRRQPRIVKLDVAAFMYHYANAYEDNGSIIVDAVHYSTLVFGNSRKQSSKDDSRPKLMRTTIHPNGLAKTHQIDNIQAELTSVNPKYYGRRYRFTYAIVFNEEHSLSAFIAKIDMETEKVESWRKSRNHFYGEPTFVPRQGGIDEDDGWVIAYGINRASLKSEFVILDAKRIADGPVATLYLDQNLGGGIHGTWSPQYYGP